MAAKQVFTIELKGLAQGAIQAEKLRDNLEELRDEIDNQADAQDAARKSLKELTAAYNAGAVSAEEYTEQSEALGAELAELTKQTAALTVESIKQEAALALQVGTLEALENAVLGAEEALRTLPAASDEFSEALAALEPVRDQFAAIQNDINGVQAEQEDLIALFGDLGEKVVGALSDGISTIAGLTGESQEAEKALQAVEIATTAVATARSIAEGRVLAVQALRVVQTRLLSKETGIFANVQEKASAAATGFGKALTTADGASKVFRGGLVAIRGALIATGIGAIVALLGTLAGELLTNAKIITTVTNAFRSLQAFIKPFAERIIPSLVAGFQAVKQVLTFDFSGAVNTIKTEFNNIIGTFRAGGDALAAEQSRQAQAAQLNVERDNLKLLELQQGLNEALITSQDQLLASQLGFQQRKAAVARKALAVDLKLSEDQIRVIEKGTAEEQAALVQRLKQQGVFNEESLGLIQEYTEARAALIQKQNEADAAAFQDQKARDDARRNLQREQLANDNTIAGQSRKIALEKEQALADIAAREAAGEVVLQEEKLAVQAKFANEARQLTIDAAEARRQAELDLRKQELEGIQTLAAEKERTELDLNAQLAEIRARRARGEQVFAQEEERIRLEAAQRLAEISRAEAEQLAQLENERLDRQAAAAESALARTQVAFDREGELRVRSRDEIEASRQAELAAIQQISELQQQRIDNDIKALEAQQLKLDPAIFQQQFEALQQTRLDLVNTYNTRVEDTNRAFDEKQQANLERQTAQFLTQLDLRSNAARQASEESQRAIEREVELQRKALDGSEGLVAQRQAAAALASLAVAEEERSLALLREQERIEQEKLDLQIRQLEAKGNITEEDRQQIEALKQAKIDLGVQLSVDTKAITDQTKAVADETSQVLADQLKTGLEDPLNTAYQNVFSQATQGLSALEKQAIQQTAQAGAQIAQQALALFEQLEQARLTRLQAAQEQIQERAAAVDEEISASRERIAELEEQTDALAASGTAAGAAREAQLANETAQIAKLEKEKKDLAAQERANAKEQERIQRAAARRQKAISIAQAVANTALGITNVLATVPAADFGVIRSILVASTAALGAIQVASIAAQPEFAEGGLVGPDGKPKKYAEGGVVQGPSHAAGGVPVVVGTSRAPAELEGGEFVARRSATENNLPILDMINRYGDQVKFQPVPAFTSTSTSPAGPDPATLEALTALATRPAVVSVVDVINGISTYKRMEVAAKL